MVDLTIAPDGAVAAAALQPPGRGLSDIAPASPTGACVLQAVRAARFPAFAGAPMKLAYPLVLDERAAIDRAQEAYVCANNKVTLPAR